MDCKVSDMVLSLCGRDKNKVFIVVRADEDYLFLADGKLRKIENPKKKKRKHVCFKTHCVSSVAEKLVSGEKVLNSEIRKLIEEQAF